MPRRPEGLTEQREDAAQDGEQRAGAEPRGGVGHGATGHRHAVCVAVTHPQRQRVGAAQRRAAAVHDEHRQAVHRLLAPPEPTALRQDGRRVVWMEGEGGREGRRWES